MTLEIWSGGQAGVDRAALDVAAELGIPARGWVPRDRVAEDGPIDARYGGLAETDSANPAVRTKRNVRDTTATLVVAFGNVTGGTLLALKTAHRLGRPVFVADLSRNSPADAARDVRGWIATLVSPVRLNVAGPRASQVTEAYARTRELLLEVLAAP